MFHVKHAAGVLHGSTHRTSSLAPKAALRCPCGLAGDAAAARSCLQGSTTASPAVRNHFTEGLGCPGVSSSRGAGSVRETATTRGIDKRHRQEESIRSGHISDRLHLNGAPGAEGRAEDGTCPGQRPGATLEE